MKEWMKTLTVSMCVLTILMHLIPNGKFVKYVKFYGGILFFLIASKPVLRIFSEEDVFERFLKLEFIKEELYDAETTVLGMQELKQEEIKQQYQNEMKRQINTVAEAYGLPVQSVKAGFEKEDGYGLTEIQIILSSNAEENNKNDDINLTNKKIDRVKKELETVFSMDYEAIKIIETEDSS